MAWNTEETRRRIKEAATAEFAEHGLAGTRMERIATRAGVNKERIYNYFGDKERLFTAVLSDEMAKMAAAVPLDWESTEDFGEYAGWCFDYHVANPTLVRLLLWEALGYGAEAPVPEEPARIEHYQRKINAYVAAQKDGVLDAEPAAAHMLFLVIAMAGFWVAVPQLARIVTGVAEGDTDELARRRAAVVLAARRMGAPQFSPTS